NDRHIRAGSAVTGRSKPSRSSSKWIERRVEIFVAQVAGVRIYERTIYSRAAQRKGVSRKDRGLCKFPRHAECGQCSSARGLPSRRGTKRTWSAAARSAKGAGRRCKDI